MDKSKKDVNMNLENKLRKRKKTRKSPNLFIARLKLCAFYSIILTVIILIGSTFLSYVLFKVESIEVDAQDVRYSKEEIIEASGFKKGENLILCNSKNCMEKIKKTMPYIGEVKVKKSIPNKISLKVMEAVPISALKLNDRYFIIDKNKKLLEITDQLPDNLLIICGIDDIQTEIGYTITLDDGNAILLENILNSIYDNELFNINEISVEDMISIYFVYDNRIKVIIGNSNNIDYKIRTASKILNENISNIEKGLLDVSLSFEDNHSYFTPDYML